jgi:hypothetical protein
MALVALPGFPQTGWMLSAPLVRRNGLGAGFHSLGPALSITR